MLDRNLLGEATTAQVAEQTGIAEDRLERLFDGSESPNLLDVSEIADALSINPMYLTRARPSIVARRDSGVDRADLDDLLERYDYHVAAYRQELGQEAISEAFPARDIWGARSHGEGWARRNNVGWAGTDSPDPLIETIEQRLRIPILIWPVPDAPFGATLNLGDSFAIWANSHDASGAHQRFTIAHELGHIMLRHVQRSLIERTKTPESAPSVGPPAHRTEEKHTQAFAGGVVCNHDRIRELWDQELTPASIAKVAAGLGISYDAASVAMSIHLRHRARGIRDIARRSSATAAFEQAGESALFESFERQRDRRRIPDVLEHSDLLARSLEQAALA